jgi:RimJ/RimL family protein N-acetyltransferase
LIGAARAEALKRLRAELLSDNGPMRRLLEKQGFQMRLASDGQTLLGVLGL